VYRGRILSERQKTRDHERTNPCSGHVYKRDLCHDYWWLCSCNKGPCCQLIIAFEPLSENSISAGVVPTFFYRVLRFCTHDACTIVFPSSAVDPWTKELAPFALFLPYPMCLIIVSVLSSEAWSRSRARAWGGGAHGVSRVALAVPHSAQRYP
jgi:hypothetical protein